ncbi:MAG: DMT family transporter, partial [Betaproteobacteria bacterium]|nr:DMT family transporter [Betaproteobacteria bacterium]
VGASLVLLPWGYWLNRQASLRGEHSGSMWSLSPLPWAITLRTGFFGGLAYALLSYSGFFFAPAAHASVLMPGFLPVWTSLLALLLLGERLHGNRLAGLAFILSGGMLVGGSSLLHAFDGGSVWMGDLFFLSASFCWSTYSVISRRYALQAVPATIAITCFAFFCFVPLYSLLALSGAIPSHLLSAPASEVLFQAAFQGGGSVVISGIAFTQMIRYFGPVRSTMITSLVPGLSALGAVVFLGEPLGLHLLLGLALVTTGILFGVRKAPLAKLAA